MNVQVWLKYIPCICDSAIVHARIKSYSRKGRGLCVCGGGGGRGIILSDWDWGVRGLFLIIYFIISILWVWIFRGWGGWGWILASMLDVWWIYIALLYTAYGQTYYTTWSTSEGTWVTFLLFVKTVIFTSKSKPFYGHSPKFVTYIKKNQKIFCQLEDEVIRNFFPTESL